MEMDRPILGYNVIKHMREDAHLLFLEMGKDVGNTVIEALSADEVSDIATVKTGRSFSITPGETVMVKGIAHTCRVTSEQFALFVPAETGRWTAYLQVHETLVSLGKGTASSVKIPVTNSSEHIVHLSKGTNIGKLSQIKSLITLQPP